MTPGADGYHDDPYDVLQVAPGASQEVLEAARRALVKRYHPDRAGGDDAYLKRINRAWELVGTPAARTAYDASRAPRAAPEPEPGLGEDGWGERVADPRRPPGPQWPQWPQPAWSVPPPYVPLPPRSRLARWALITACVGVVLAAVGPVALVLGVLGIVETTNRGMAGRWSAVAGVVLGTAETGLFLVMLLT